MKIIIIGNGILSLMTAFRLIRRDPHLNIKIIGPTNCEGSASLAAAAMFNSFCEIDKYTLVNSTERQKFIFNHSSNSRWPSLISEIENASKSKLNHGFGTYLINNTASDQLEDENFDSIVSGLKEFKEPFEFVEPRNIPFYSPENSFRAQRALYIPREGWINPVMLLNSLRIFLKDQSTVEWIDNKCHSLRRHGNSVKSIQCNDGTSMEADLFLLSPGANFTKIIAQSNLEMKFPRILYGIGASILLKTDSQTLSNCIRTPNRGLACGIYSAPFNQDHTLVGASNLVSTEPESHARVTSISTLLNSSIEQLNRNFYRAQLVKVNIGWRPTSEDNIPLLGKTEISNLFVATGTKRDGLHCSPQISDALADLMLEGKSNIPLSLFRPNRDPVRYLTRNEAVEMSVRHTLNAHFQHGFKPSHSSIIADLESFYRGEFERVHDQIGAHDWGIPPEMINIYRSGFLTE